MGIKKALFWPALLASLPLVALLGVLLFVFFAPLDSQAPPRIIDAKPGSSFHLLSRKLKEERLIRSALAFKALAKIYGGPPLFAGEYQLSPARSLWSQFQTLRRGQTFQPSITFPEGLNHYEMFLLLKARGVLSAGRFRELASDPQFALSLLKEPVSSLEGYLFPDTYLAGKYMPAEKLLRQMAARFLEVYEGVMREHGGGRHERQSAPASGFSRHSFVTLASIIEKESGADGERGRVAAVFHNRLRKGMRLQADPTILYSLFLRESFERELKIGKKDILHPSPYNTYFAKGLPPGPIANPGEESLKAALFPPSTDDLYFVSRNDGTHVFSKTLKEHEKAVYKYQIAPFRKRAGNKAQRP